MISSKTLTFLRALKKNNNREWFHKNKERYDEVYHEWKDFVYALANEIAKFDPDVKKDLTHKKTIKVFRIYRDVRFSKDKTPYNEHLSGYIVPAGKEDKHPGYYVHLMPGGSFAGAGLHNPPSPVLKSIRTTIAKKPETLRSILKETKFKKLYGGLRDFDPVKTAPRGYAIDHPAIDLLRHKGFFVTAEYTNQEVTSKDFVKKLAKNLALTKPFTEYLKKAV